MNIELAKKILEKIDEFAEPINSMSKLIDEISDESERKAFRKSLGEVMGLLDGEIGYQIRRRFDLHS